MKKILYLLIIMLLSISARADYNGYHIKFKIETAKGETKVGYAHVASAYLDTDSIENTDYLKRALDQTWDERNKRDTLVFFKDRIKYQYQSVGDSLGEAMVVYALRNKQVVPCQDIKLIRIVEMIDYTYLIGISSPLSMSDISWINKKPLQSYAFSGYLCYHQVFVHVNSKKIEGVIRRLKIKEKFIESMDVNYENGDEVDIELGGIIKELYGEKVVVITECTC